MKLKTLLFFTIIFSSNNIISQTLDETIKFIETKFPTYQPSLTKSTIKIDDYGNIIINDEVNSEKSKTTFNINDVKIIQTVDKYDPDYFGTRYVLTIECINQEHCINITNVMGISSLNAQSVTENFRGKVELEKIFKSLTHLKSVVKKEPF